MKTFKLAKNNGQSMVEFAIYAPLIVIFLWAMTDFSIMFVQSGKLGALSRQAAYSAFKDCYSLDGPALKSCMQDIVDDLSKKADDMMPEFVEFEDAAHLNYHSKKGVILLTAYTQKTNGTTRLPLEISRVISKGKNVDLFTPKRAETKMSSDWAAGDEFVLKKGGKAFTAEVFYKPSVSNYIHQIIMMAHADLENLYAVTLW